MSLFLFFNLSHCVFCDCFDFCGMAHILILWSTRSFCTRMTDLTAFVTAAVKLTRKLVQLLQWSGCGGGVHRPVHIVVYLPARVSSRPAQTDVLCVIPGSGTVLAFLKWCEDMNVAPQPTWSLVNSSVDSRLSWLMRSHLKKQHLSICQICFRPWHDC